MSSTEVRSGLKYGWGLGVSGWDTEMDADLLQIGRVGLHLSVRNRTTTAPPGSPADGDTYIPAATATGAWAGHENDVAVWNGAAWVFYAPRTGWVAYIEDEAKLSAFAAGAWSAGVAL
jgi:hypothetical protein